MDVVVKTRGEVQFLGRGYCDERKTAAMPEEYSFGVTRGSFKAVTTSQRSKGSSHLMMKVCPRSLSPQTHGRSSRLKGAARLGDVLSIPAGTLYSVHQTHVATSPLA